MKIFRTIAALLGLSLLPSLAWAQGALLQAGAVTAGHVPMYVTQGTGQAVVQDAGGAGGGGPGVGLSEMSLTARGTGTPPYSGQGTGPLGTNFCDYDAPTTNPTGYHYLCLSANATGGNTLIAAGAGGGASTIPFMISVNGTSYPFPFSIGGIVGPPSTTVGHLATWNNTVGTLLADGGVPLTGPGTTTIGHLATWGNGGGTLLADGGVPISLSVPNTWTAVQTFPNNSLTFAELPSFNANTVLSNWTGSGGAPLANTWPACANDGAHALVYVNGTGLVCGSISGAPTAPQMRLTLVSGLPIPTTDQSGITSHWCTPYPGGSASATSFVPITTNGTTFAMTPVGELTQTTADTTKSPSAVANNSVYDVFLWSDSGTIRCTRGPAWSSDTNRGTGAGTSEIDFTTVFPTNKNAITNGPAANRGVLVGSVRSNGAAALMDTALFRWVSNLYNAVPRKVALVLSGSSGGYGTASWRQWDGNAANQIDLLQTLAGLPLQVSALGEATDTTVNAFCPIAIGIDSTTVPSGFWASNQLVTIGATQNTTANYADYAGLGRHLATMIEYASVATCTQVGASAVIQSGLFGTVQN